MGSPVFDLELRTGAKESHKYLDNYGALLQVVHDVGGQPDLPLKIEAPDEEVWEKSIHATCECLAWRGIWNAEMRRRTETDLGQTLYSGVPYYGRWVLAAAHQLIVGNHITQDELRDKMVEIRRRLEEQSGEV